MATYVKVAGTWKEVTSDSPSNGVCGYVKVNGTWRTVNQSYVRINGVWRSTCTAPGQQPAAIPETICYRPNYCLNGTNGVILPTTEPCYLADGVSLGTRTAPYTCQTDPGCVTYTVPAGTCTAPDPIIQVVSEEIGDCEFWGGLSGCTTGYAKRVTKKYSDNSIKVSYSCCNPLTPNLKYYCTLRPFSTGECQNELKDTDFTGQVVAGVGEWVCEELGTISFPSCSTTENCAVPKTSESTYEPCGYLSTGQRLVTTNTYQSWCETTQDTVVGACIGAADPCGGNYCSAESGEESYSTSSCPSGTGIRYKCITPEGCNTLYSFRRCVPVVVVEPPDEPNPVLYKFTEVCYTTPSTSSAVVSCTQYEAYSSRSLGTNCTASGTTAATFIPCPATTPLEVETEACPTLREIPNQPCITTDGRAGTNTILRTPANCPDRYTTCVAQFVTGGGQAPCCIDDDAGSCQNVGADGYGTWFQNQYDPCAYTTCPPVNRGRTFCGVPNTGGPPPPCPVLFTLDNPCGNGGTQSIGVTPQGCDNVVGPCVGETAPVVTPTEPPVTNPTGPTYTIAPGAVTTTSPGDSTSYWESTPTEQGGSVLELVDAGTGNTIGEPIVFPPLTGFLGGLAPKSININTLVRTKDGLVPAFDLKVGDKLLSADIETFPYDNLLATNIDLIQWTAQNPHINLVETEIVGLRTRTSRWAIIVDSDIFSDSHYILVNRDDVTKFVKAIELESTDLIWSNTYHNWVSIGVLKKVDVDHEVVSIDCEPYDIFFTERMLTHDSNTVD
jgi:hypothetical protein